MNRVPAQLRGISALSQLQSWNLLRAHQDLAERGHELSRERDRVAAQDAVVVHYGVALDALRRQESVLRVEVYDRISAQLDCEMGLLQSRRATERAAESAVEKARSLALEARRRSEVISKVLERRRKALEGATVRRELAQQEELWLVSRS